MKLLTVFFDSTGRYRKLYPVFVESAKSRIPNVEVEKYELRPPQKKLVHTFDTCYAHLQACKKILKDKQDVAVCDCDLLFKKDITDLWKQDFDIAITVRKIIPYNTGIWWYRHNSRSERFIKEWVKNTLYIRGRVINDDIPAKRFVAHHGGIDQASLAITIEKNNYAKVLKLDSVIWNACQHEWEFITKDTRVIHIKSKLRKYCFGQLSEPPEYLIPIIKIWREYYDRARKLYGLDRKTKNKKSELRRRNKKRLRVYKKLSAL